MTNDMPPPKGKGRAINFTPDIHKLLWTHEVTGCRQTPPRTGDMATRAVLSRHINLLHRTRLCFRRQQCCEYLSAAYQCEEAWNGRLQSPLVKNVKPGDYIYDLEQKYKREGKISAIDVDLLMNAVDGSKAIDLVSDVEEIVHRLRRSRESVFTLPSTHHAVLRYLQLKSATDTILKIISDPLNYGIFPDHYTSNLLMDTFLEQENYTAAARVASVNMLQEDFGPPLTQTLALASCFAYVTCENNQPWINYKPKPEEPAEEVKIRVKYLRNPYFDDHFDLQDPNHIVGKTLAWLSPLVGGMIGASCELLGWALYNKWGDLEAALHRIKDGNDSVAVSMVQRIKEIIDQCEDGDAQERLKVAMSHLEQVEGKVKEVEMWPAIQTLLSQVTAQAEQQDIKAQNDTYQYWEKRRAEEFQRQLDEYRKRELLDEIEEKKKDLAEREQVIFFFDNKEKLELVLQQKKDQYKDKSKYQKKQKKKVDTDYIPPEV
ncbi:hypothetical protein Pcinc_025458 [Petrolisthes cinctipes]|uniref:28S ribosomal protein S27, mitochondrial n=1 Tax=Petrolisthes cinctipes TaxID=88211 RepID=A0AAE1KBL1_PETCI|nr:hypothetical protein Pcinc_025458 [Petrolisthes cinctipes]